MDEIDAVRDALRHSHRELETFAKSLPPADLACRSYCTEWTVAQVYSHLGSGAEIEAARIQAALSGEPAPNPGPIWQRWNALVAAEAVGRFASADAGYLKLITELDLDEVGNVQVSMDSLQVPLGTAMVMRLAEHALHSWDVYVAFNDDAEVASDAAELLVDLYPREIISMVASLKIASKLGSASLRIDIAKPRRTLTMAFGETVTVDTAREGSDEATTGRLRLPTGGAWARLLTGRLDDDHLPADVTSTGTPALHDLRTALQGDPMAASTGESRE
jgi:uncharacterized protein (TIGR03083 family)